MPKYVHIKPEFSKEALKEFLSWVALHERKYQDTPVEKAKLIWGFKYPALARDMNLTIHAPKYSESEVLHIQLTKQGECYGPAIQ